MYGSDNCSSKCIDFKNSYGGVSRALVNTLIKFMNSEKATKFCKIFTVVPVNSTVEISQNFVVFSEYMNFTENFCNSTKAFYF